MSSSRIAPLKDREQSLSARIGEVKGANQVLERRLSTLENLVLVQSRQIEQILALLMKADEKVYTEEERHPPG